MIAIVLVQESEGKTTWWVGAGGTDRHYEVPRMIGAWYNGIMGHSEMSEDALEYFKKAWRQTSDEVSAMLREKQGG